ncbi:hypothetical protein [Methylocella sp.]|uniref:hypothetical protein n=1 Tax=Methylocella sp. TaxID=1978226 RepID=UPI003783BD94
MSSLKRSARGFALALALGLPASAALAEGPFSSLSGYWTGGGTIATKNGVSERIRCRATYAVNDPGTALNQSLRCASDSYRLEITGNLSVINGALSGNWTEATRHATGQVSGGASATEIMARVDGVGFSAGLNVRFKGGQQSISIRPTMGSDVTAVTITLRKG